MLLCTIGATVAVILVLVTVAIATIVVCTVAIIIRIIVSLGSATVVALIVVAIVAGCLVISTILVIVSSLLSILALVTVTLITTLRSLLVLSDSSSFIVWLLMGDSGELASLRNGASSHNCLIFVVSELCNLITLDPLTFS